MKLLYPDYSLLFYLGLADALLWIFLLVQIGWLLMRFSSLVRFCRNPDTPGPDAGIVLSLFNRMGIAVLGIVLIRVAQIIYSVIHTRF